MARSPLDYARAVGLFLTQPDRLADILSSLAQ